MERRGRVVKEGYLTKSPPQDKSLAHWHRRFFVLWSSRLMEYYSTSEKKPQDYLKTINLANCSDMVAPISFQKRTNVIKLTIKEKDSEKMRDYYFEGDSAAETNDWVKCFAQVLGFAPVDEVAPQTNGFFHNLSHPPRPPHPYQPNKLHKSHPTPPCPYNPNKKPKAPPKPPQPLPVLDQQQEDYEIPQEIMQDFLNEDDNMHHYHILSPTQPEPEPEDRPELHYEDIQYDDEEELQSSPPPIWKTNSPPPPLPSAPIPRLWRRSAERDTESSLDFSQLPNPNKVGRPLPPPPSGAEVAKAQQQPQRKSYEQSGLRRKNYEKNPPHRKSYEQNPPVRKSYEQNVPQRKSYEQNKPQRRNYEHNVKPNPPFRRNYEHNSATKTRNEELKLPAEYEESVPTKPLPPPTRPKSGMTPGSELALALKKDLKFTQKLHERRQEIYGVTDVMQEGGELEVADADEGGWENYEEVTFTGYEGDFEMPLPPRERKPMPLPNQEATITMVETQEGYAGIEVTGDGQPQNYLDVNHHQSHFDVEETSWSGRVSPGPPVHRKTPSIRRELENTLGSDSNSPPIPPRGLKPTTAIQLTSPRPSYPKGSLPATQSRQERSNRSPSRSPENHSPHERSPPGPPHLLSRGPITTTSKPIPKRRSSTPPPLPLHSREVITSPHRTGPTQDAKRRGSAPLSPPPPPLPLRDLISPVAPPVLKRNRSPLPRPGEEVESSPPPVPRRHPQHSDRLRASNIAEASRTACTVPVRRTPTPENIENRLPLPPRGVSPHEDRSSSPVPPRPVPSRDTSSQEFVVSPWRYSEQPQSLPLDLEHAVLVRSISSPPEPSEVMMSDGKKKLRPPCPPPKPMATTGDVKTPRGNKPMPKPKPPLLRRVSSDEKISSKRDQDSAGGRTKPAPLPKPKKPALMPRPQRSTEPSHSSLGGQANASSSQSNWSHNATANRPPVPARNW